MSVRDTLLPVIEQQSGRRIIHPKILGNLMLKEAGLSRKGTSAVRQAKVSMAVKVTAMRKFMRLLG